MAGSGVTERVRATAGRVPAPVLVLVAIASVQTGSAVARTAFDVTGAAGITLLRLAISAAGVALLGLHRSGSVPLGGLALALLAGMFWAGYILASARVGSLLPGLDGLAVALLVAALLALPFGAAGAAPAFTDGPAL